MVRLLGSEVVKLSFGRKDTPLADCRQDLSKLSPSSLEHEYQRVHQDCRIEGTRFSATRTYSTTGDAVESTTRASEIAPRGPLN
jgi:hypothetical protein